MTRTPAARDNITRQVNYIRQKITYLDEGSAIDFTEAKLPANATVVGGGVHVVTAFNDSGTDQLDVGFRDGSSTDDPDAYATLLDLSAVGFIALDELAATTNVLQTKDAILTWTYSGQNNNASAGLAYIIIEYVV